MGAWIETTVRVPHQHMFYVAPYVGAWIETFGIAQRNRKARVAPYVGAWIETYSYRFYYRYVESHPTWVRGLKH